MGVEATTNYSTGLFLFGVNMTPGIQISLTAMDHKNLKWDEPLTYRPDVLVTLKTSLRIGRGYVEANYRYASEIEEVKIYPINDRVPMKFIDLRASYDVGFLTLQVGVENLLQYNYAPMESNLMPMRTFTAGLKGDF